MSSGRSGPRRGSTVERVNDMVYNRLGDSGLAVSRVGLGTNNFGKRTDVTQSRAVVDAALDAGINFIDTSDSYGESETILGEILEGRRDEVVLATKFGSDLTTRRDDVPPDWGARGSRRYIRQAVERSLRRLRTDWIDLYQLHFPDPATPIAETLAALDELIAEGKIRYAGSSNLSAWRLADAVWTARTEHRRGFISAQNHWNLLNRDVEADLVPAAGHYGVGIIPYFPLAGGLLTGKYRRGEAPPAGSRIATDAAHDRLTEATFDIVEPLGAFAAERDTTLAGVAIGWLAARAGVASVIAGATRPEQVASNVTAAAWRPTADDLAEIDRITLGFAL